MAFEHEPQNHIGATNIWLTPKYIIDALGPFDLDPCAAPEPRPWQTALKHYIEKDDGLTLPWNGLVWCNPPYGKETGLWLNKLAQHGNGIALVFARTETAWFQSVANLSSLMLFLSGRVKFCLPNGQEGKSNSGAPSVLISFGEDAKMRLLCSKLSGFYSVKTQGIKHEKDQ